MAEPPVEEPGGGHTTVEIPIDSVPNVPIIPIDQTTYAPHARRHELTGDDQVHPSVQNSGVQLNRFRTLNFTTGLTVTEDSVNRRYNIATSGIPNITGVTTAAWDPPVLSANTSSATTVFVSGAALGDIVLVSFSIALLDGMILSGFVSGVNTVVITLSNIRADSPNIGSGTLNIRLLKP